MRFVDWVVVLLVMLAGLVEERKGVLSCAILRDGLASKSGVVC